jgi:tRNA G10  N-methylase Trm11
MISRRSKKSFSLNIRPIHPFPARMAPEIAIAELGRLKPGSTVFDPMMGSGTVLRHAVEFGHKAIGFDMDPLAILMSRVWSTSVPESTIETTSKSLLEILPSSSHVSLPWIDDEEETSSFVSFWFGDSQRRDLRRLAFGINRLGANADRKQRAAVDVLRVAMSRIIITKSSGASLAHDVSHSRPHKVMQSSDFNVMEAFRRSLKQVRSRLESTPKNASVKTSLGDARELKWVRKETVDLVLTSPPYLNAIDYMRGHKLSLVWLGHSIPDLRVIRSSSIGAERRAAEEVTRLARTVQRAMVQADQVEPRHLAMVERYSLDLVKMMQQVARILKPDGKAILVVGNSCLKEAFITNSEGVKKAATAAGLKFLSETIRELPTNSRYLPMPKKSDSALGKRMRTESILKFRRTA